MKALIVKTSSLGDILHAFPVLSYLRSRGYRVDWVVESRLSELVAAHPEVERVIEVDTKRWRKTLLRKETRRAIRAFRSALRLETYDLLFDLQGNIKSALITAQGKAALKVGFGAKCVPEWPNLAFTRKRFNPPGGRNIREDYLFLAQALFDDHCLYDPPGVQLAVSDLSRVESLLAPPGYKLIVCPGSAWPNKQLSKPQLARLLKRRFSHAHLIWVWGTEGEKAFAEACLAEVGGCLAPGLSLPELQRLMSGADQVLAMDSLSLHLCGTTDTPSMSFFGPSLAAKYKPLGTQHEALQGACPYGETFDKRCKRLRSCPTGACLKGLQVEALCDSAIQPPPKTRSPS